MLKSLATQPEVFAQGTNVLDSIVKVYTVYSRPGGLPTRSPPPPFPTKNAHVGTPSGAPQPLDV